MDIEKVRQYLQNEETLPNATEEISKDLIEQGFTPKFSTIDEIVIDFLTEEPIDAIYLQNRFEMRETQSKALITYFKYLKRQIGPEYFTFF